MTAPTPTPGRWEKWKKTEPARLACYVDPEEIARLYAGSSPGPTYLQRAADLRAAVGTVYEGLAAQGLRYATAAIDFRHFHPAEQVVRTPAEIAGQGGNCLELTLLFVGLCMASKLRALVVLLEDHALAAVWLGGDLDTLWTRGRTAVNDHLIMDQGLINKAAGSTAVRTTLTEQVADGTYLLVECTGVAAEEEPGTRSLRRTFEEAVAEGLERTGRGRLVDLVDVAFHQHGKLYPPYAIPAPPPAPGAPAPGPPDPAAPDPAGPVPAGPERPSALGEQALDTALRRAAAVHPALAAGLDAARHSPAALVRVLDAAGTAPATPEALRLREVAAALALALDAHAFIAAWMPQAAHPAALRRALLDCVADTPGLRPSGLAEHLDAAVLHRPVDDPDGRATLLRFVVRLAATAGLDTGEAAFTDWCRRAGHDLATAELLHRKFRNLTADARRRLVVHLRGTTPAEDLPASADAWLLDERGRPTHTRPTTPCRPDPEGLADTLADILDWADGILGTTLLHRVDIALPAPTLLQWRPEEADVGIRLGAHHLVVLHWGARIHPPGHLRRLSRQAAYRLRHVEDDGDTVYGSVDWVDPATAGNREDFEERLGRNDYPGALGLRFAPADPDPDHQFEALLARFPILLWPGRAVTAWPAVEEDVRDHWVTLPGGFTHAYRTAWACAEDAGPPLARLRAVWDDGHWLAFCHTTSTHTAGIGTAAGGRRTSRTRGRR
ncbi:hypothetical protein [Streptomyces sp. W1SF4]|uniref:vWA-MoxR associated conflict system protein n=1 Tax=Streptomyces sp. W1SF4 TaxID=2305220 RepID=UPI000F6BCD94|nr:hypothetical protein [Streptomyces sp. W1SF4]AZM93599.1 hypothetical protein D1J60_34150 [Streptomyces sp. W1SF4]